MRQGRWIDSAILFVFALGIRLNDLSFAPDVDEFHHVLAAQSLLSDGNLSLAGGEAPYTRGLLYTLIVAGFFAIFGESLEVARIPAILGGATLVVVLYLWVRSASNRLAGWISALLLCTYPFGIYLTQVSRFYSLHALFFLLGVMAVHRLVSDPADGWRQTLTLGAGATVALALAFHLQITVVVGIGALALWIVADRANWIVNRVRRGPRSSIPLVAVAGAVLLLGGVIWFSGFGPRALFLFQYADPWAFEHRDNLRFYHRHLQSGYGPLWAFFPILILVTLHRNLRFGLLCPLLFGVVLVAHSLAAWKHPRYVFYVMPFFFAIVGVAIAGVVPALRALLTQLVGRIGSQFAGGIARPVLLIGTTVGVVGFALVGFGASSDFVRMMQPGPDSLESPRPYRGKAEWATAQPTLMELSRDAEVLVSYSHLKPPYYLGRLDVILQRNHLYQGDIWQPEFTLQPQLARPVISRPESLAGIVSCYGSGMVIGEHFGWRDPAGVPSGTVDWIEEELNPVPLPPEWRILVYTWESDDDEWGETGLDVDCAQYPVGLQGTEGSQS